RERVRPMARAVRPIVSRAVGDQLSEPLISNSPSVWAEYSWRARRTPPAESVVSISSSERAGALMIRPLRRAVRSDAFQFRVAPVWAPTRYAVIHVDAE